MSIDLNWEALTSGPDGEALAASIRDFVHTKFQAVPLPRFIKSVAVHDFEFGKVPPKVVLKDICDPLPDFYEEDPDVDYGDEEEEERGEGAGSSVGGGSRVGGGSSISDGGYLHDDIEGVGSGSRFGEGPEDAEDGDLLGASVETLGGGSSRAGGGGGGGGGNRPPRTPPRSKRRGQSEDRAPETVKPEHRRHAELDRRRHGYGSGGGGGGYRDDNPFQRHELRRFNSERSEFPFPSHLHLAGAGLRSGTPEIGTPFLGLGASTPGIAAGMSNMHYFQSKLGSGTQTPLAAVAGAQHLGGWLNNAGYHHHQHHHASGSSTPALQAEARRRAATAAQLAAQQRGADSSSAIHSGGPGSDFGSHAHQQRFQHHRNSSQSSISITEFRASLNPPPLAPPLLREKHSVSTLAPTSNGHSRPPTRDGTSSGAGQPTAFSAPSPFGGDYDDATPYANPNPNSRGHHARADDDDDDNSHDDDSSSQRRFREPRVDDMQAVFRIKYSGDVRLRLTAEILLDYPMPSFVGIPLKLNITGLTFDGVGVIANIRKRVHFCFLSPDDALAALGGNTDSSSDDDDDEDDGDDQQGGRGQGHGSGDSSSREPEGNAGSGSGDGVGGGGIGADMRRSNDKGKGKVVTSTSTAPPQLSGADHRLIEQLTLGGGGGGGGADTTTTTTTTNNNMTSPSRHSPGKGNTPYQHGAPYQQHSSSSYPQPPQQQPQQPQQHQSQSQSQQKGRVGGLLQEIRVESEIGQREGTKQSLKNVGKVERFVLEQVRRIFEEELVYPSFWTFLV